PSLPSPPHPTRLKVTSVLDYDVPAPLTFLLNVRAQTNAFQKVVREQFILPSRMPHAVFECATTGSRFDRVEAEVPGVYSIRYEAEVELNAERLQPAHLPEAGPAAFDLDVLPYLYPSRYCQSDRLGRLTLDNFGSFTTPEEKARAVVAWISTHIAYVSGSTDVGTSAVDSLVERVGVCRDFAHLGIALCRAMNIPARYFTGYAHGLPLPDFHACFETWIGGRWLVWDATGMSSPDSVVRIGTGRDAADCSICTAFGSMRLRSMTVDCQVLDEGYEKMKPEEIAREVISLEPAAT
ncbi:MAG TPA: transglutaminase family protein, partial [Prosthecobacter sp.]|nr:transglutaminase family protein [Prosthecobacter sp.]